MSKRSQRIVNSSLLKKNKTSKSIALDKPNASHEYKFFKPRQLFKSATSGVDKNNEVILNIQPTQSLLAKQNVSQNNEVILSQMIQPTQSLLAKQNVSPNNEVILSQIIEPNQSLLELQNVFENNEVILSQMIEPNQSLLELQNVSEVSYIVEYFT
ncbi:unnamed protein product [Macrosiphum euphorbiae]|uniref:Uncharacterized protein n=1 Tax=Macrosiphum euphorbiae TaxID=13131 RepID=A0AAV0WS94_9HEMI|nr:unnamed protein product [Macrosiphum euphorbiae]